MKAAAANCLKPVLAMPDIEITTISDKAKVTRWRKGSGLDKSLRHSMGSEPIWLLRLSGIASPLARSQATLLLLRAIAIWASSQAL